MENGYESVRCGNDRDILELISENNDHAFELLYKRYWNSLNNFAFHFLKDKDTCEELVQALLVQLYKRRLELKIRSSVSSYLCVALRNKILNHLRDQALYKRHVAQASKKINHVHNNVEQTVDLNELQQRIFKLLGVMPPKCREVFVLHQRHHFTVKKISEILNRPPDTVEKQLRRANDSIRRRLSISTVSSR